ncbi:O-antigen ligase family protein [Thermodesulfobacteriota bacterium B35]
MGIYPLFYLVVVISGWFMAFWKGPIWGLLTYAFIYFNIPSHQWWGGQVPDLRWSMLAAVLVIASCFFHARDLASTPFFRNPLGLILLALLAWMMIIAPFTPDPARSWAKVYDFFRYVLIFFLINKTLSDFARYRLFTVTLLLCTFYIAVLAHHYFSGSRLDGVGLPDASDANMLAALVILLLPLYVVAIFAEKGMIRVLPLLAMVLVINMFVMCGSRGAFVGLLVQGGLALPLLSKRIGLIKSLACCLLVFLCLFNLMSPQYKSRLLGMEQGIRDDNAEMGNISAGRTEIWKYGLLMASDYPFGAGGGSFQAMSPRYIPGFLLTGGERASHNTYLLVLVEQGWIGLGIFLLFIYSQFHHLHESIKLFHGITLSPEQKKILYNIYAVGIGLVGFWAASFFIDRLYFEGIYLVAALIPVLGRLSKEVTVTSSTEDSQTVKS